MDLFRRATTVYNTLKDSSNKMMVIDSLIEGVDDVEQKLIYIMTKGLLKEEGLK